MAMYRVVVQAKGYFHVEGESVGDVNREIRNNYGQGDILTEVESDSGWPDVHIIDVIEVEP